MGGLWLLSHVWDPFDMRGRGVWEGYRRAFIWIFVLTAAGEAIYVVVGRSGGGEPSAAAPLVEAPGGLDLAAPPPGAAETGAPPPGGPAAEPERRTSAEWLADPPRPPESELETPGEALRSLARVLAIACWVAAIALGLLGFTCAAQEPSFILGTDPQGAARTSFLMAGGSAIAGIVLWWLGRKRR
jgi:hypothetical protein